MPVWTPDDAHDATSAAYGGTSEGSVPRTNPTGAV